MTKWVLIFALVALAPMAAAQSSWTLVRSTLIYHVVHPLHRVEGVSHAARGRGACHPGKCDFLIAAPVNSFRSGDTDRDLHMLQVTRGAQFPMITVRAAVPARSLHPGTLQADLRVSFAGQQKEYAQVPFRISAAEKGGLELQGTIPATLTDFKITPPELLMMPIHNDIPIQVDLTWRPDAPQ
ncbi:MAG: hypothetical protein ACRD1C_11665 [Terriglobales bacterium]